MKHACLIFLYIACILFPATSIGYDGWYTAPRLDDDEFVKCSVGVEDGVILIEPRGKKNNGKFFIEKKIRIPGTDIKTVTFSYKGYPAGNSLKSGAPKYILDGELFAMEYKRPDGTTGIDIVHLKKKDAFEFKKYLKEISKQAIIIIETTSYRDARAVVIDF